ncbi:apolipoprotein N-acyltransferase [Epibacterium sp. SM1979]|uniref:Apolipoprotein N-acyltransferase n=1 Tax=Tritonibacter litoralis TaxID=2662264 RepID=A0A843YHF7_9RHOB|nr:apolipoprotein N-acyltransferase [Tritonibacter litoralis]MQQ09258.1 apolipoprotein N-acyltransferase [Tritonibacter litoralis]
MVARVGPVLAALLLGALMAHALAPHNWLGVTPVALVSITFLLLRARTVRAAGGLGWFFGFGYFLNGLSWILEPFQVEAELYGWMAPFALVFLAGGLALFWGAAFALAQRCAAGNWRVLALIGFWSLLEFARAYALTGFPWAGLAQLGITPWTFGVLPLLGPHGFAIVKLMLFLPLALLRMRRIWPVLPLAGYVLTVFSLLPEAPREDGVAYTDHTVRLVQPNAPQDEKWHPDKRWDFVRRQVAFSANEPRPDLIVWPETAVPQLLNYADDTLAAISQAAHGVPILLGIQREEDGRYFNSAVLLDESGVATATYDKMHLVPFGEYMPFPDLVARFGIYGLAARAEAGYSAGEARTFLDTPAGRTLLLICYEGVFAHEIDTRDARPDYLTLITNDAWFGTYSGPQQHLVQAQMRAAEQGLPMVRVANTGVSAMIDPYGRIVPGMKLPLGQAGYIDADLPAPLPPTLYSRTGDLPWFLLAVFLTAGSMISRRSGHSRKEAVNL